MPYCVLPCNGYNIFYLWAIYAVAEHVIKTDHNIGWEDFEILYSQVFLST